MFNFKKYNKYKVPLLFAGALSLLYVLSDSTQSNKNTSEEIDKEAGEAEEEGIKLTYPISNYNIFADSLESAMFDAGTNESIIFDIFKKLKNARDLLQLIKAFGRREYFSFGWKQGDYNIAQWFTEELSSSEISKINAILKKNGINYSF